MLYPDRSRATCQEYIVESEVPRDSTMCVLAPIEEPGESNNPEDMPYTELELVRVTEFSLQDEIVEDIAPDEDPVTVLEKANNKLRRWVVCGVGGLIVFAIILSFVLVLFRPSLAEFSAQFLQIVVGGLVGLAGSVMGFLFAVTNCECRQTVRSNGRERTVRVSTSPIRRERRGCDASSTPRPRRDRDHRCRSVFS